MTLPDNRIRFSSALTDFPGQVGTTGQAHDQFPAPGQARYDWMRMFLIGLLSCQSSYSEPTQYRAGTLWFDLNTETLRIWVDETPSGGTWVSLSEAISLVDGDDPATTISLQDWYNQISPLLATTAPSVVFNGTCSANNTLQITVPLGLQAQIKLQTSKPFVYINGLLIDPRKAALSGPTTIILKNGAALSLGDRFTVEIKNIPNNLFWTADVPAP